MNSDQRRLIIGLGTGRCGTSSLRALIDGQSRSVCFHELRSHESGWSGAEDSVRTTVRKLEKALELQSLKDMDPEPGHKGKEEVLGLATARLDGGEAINVAGDIAFYYLNYVEFIQDVSTVPVSFVCMQRSREEVVTSYVRKMRLESGIRNHWIEHPSEKWVADAKWDKCYPTYTESTLKAAISRYYDHYAEVSEKLASKHQNFAIFDVDLLNDSCGRARIMQHAGYDPVNLSHPLKSPHENASE